MTRLRELETPLEDLTLAPMSAPETGNERKERAATIKARLNSLRSRMQEDGKGHWFDIWYSATDDKSGGLLTELLKAA